VDAYSPRGRAQDDLAWAEVEIWHGVLTSRPIRGQRKDARIDRSTDEWKRVAVGRRWKTTNLARVAPRTQRLSICGWCTVATTTPMEMRA